MREIKFRAWDKETGDMIYSDKEEYNYGFKLECGVVRCYFCDITVDVCGDEYIDHVFLDNIMQYTGLKDKNNIEVYEGDIIEHIEFGMKCVVGFKNGAFTKSLRNSNIHLLYDSNIEDGKLTDWVVIGNIYEDKLL